jgi:hypothetical protein
VAVALVVHGALIKTEVPAVSEAAEEADWDTTRRALIVEVMGVMADSVEVAVGQPVVPIVLDFPPPP